MKPFNKHEQQCWNILEQQGYSLLRNGWPDIVAFKDNEVLAVEVKATEEQRLSKEQKAIMELLSRSGIKCQRWTPIEGFCHYTERPKRKKKSKYKKTTVVTFRLDNNIYSEMKKLHPKLSKWLRDKVAEYLTT